jgi:hypothetical protein
MLDTKSDLRYALDVMEEYSHLGLDDEYASKLREILARQIDNARAGLSNCPPASVRFSASTKSYA